jgi:hypothetical protein
LEGDDVTDEDAAAWLHAQEQAIPGIGDPEQPVPEVQGDDDERLYEKVKRTAETALNLTREQLAALLKQRDDINAEIQLLRGEEELLERMSRVAKGNRVGTRTRTTTD